MYKHERQQSVREMRGKIWSPGRPSTARREHRLGFWKAIARGLTSEDAAAEVGMSSAFGTRSFREAGGMPPLKLVPTSGRYLSLAEREEIAILHAQKHGVREIARRIGRSPSTISRELRRNASTRTAELEYRASTAQWHAERRASRPKVAKLAANERLRDYVQDRLAGKIEQPDGTVDSGPDVAFIGRRHGRRADRRWGKAWSPEQISHRLRVDFPDDESMRISHEAIYQALYIQGRGALRRELVACLRTGRALRVPRARTRERGKKFVTPELLIDFRPINQAWLREVAKRWARDVRPYLHTLRQAIKACAVASRALTAAGRSDPSELNAGDFTRVVDAITGQRRADGSLYSASYRNLLVQRCCEVIEHGRTSGLMGEVPYPFRPAKRRHRVVEDANEDELGKALPDSVIRQLDQHLELLGPSRRFGSMGAADLPEMHQTIYRILRDTGRRPGEVVSLKVGCIEVIDGQQNLIYDNHKAARKRRRLPITAETAEVILAWEHRRRELPTPPATRQWLFPSPLLRSRQSLGHLTSSCVGVVFRAWVRAIPAIDSEVLGPDGVPLAFERSLITPYVLRHCYAQRHADAGVPVDVLKELLDHLDIQTTMGYYSVSLKRKQHAVSLVGSLAFDAGGNPAPFADAVAYERASVSVPFGNCTEASNVKAGGGHCPIRFQCAGCGFYRPDPSYLPALEEHIASLRADRETASAIGAADYVTANMSAEIDAFGHVAETMRRRLAELGPDERAEVEESSRILRRARAARRIPVVAASATGTA